MFLQPKVRLSFVVVLCSGLCVVRYMVQCNGIKFCRNSLTGAYARCNVSVCKAYEIPNYMYHMSLFVLYLIYLYFDVF